LLPQPVDDVIDLELEQELDFTLVLAAAALLARAALLGRIGEHITRLGLALSGALLLLRTTQTEVVVLQHPYRHAHGAGAFVDDIRAGNDLRQMLAYRFAHLLIVPQPVACAAREQLIPLCRIGRTGLIAALGHGLFVLLSGAACNS